jgi:hypothetical protein
MLSASAFVYWGAFAVSDTGKRSCPNSSSVASQSILSWYNRMGDEIAPSDPRPRYTTRRSRRRPPHRVDIADKKAANVDDLVAQHAGGTGARFTFETVEEADGVWSPDG